jgi:four helix bundle protein
MRENASRNSGYRSLIAWEKAMDGAVRVLDLCDLIPPRSGAGVVPQLRRSVVSIPSNIAEGYDRPALEQLVFLRHSRGSLWEAATQLEILERRGRLKTETLRSLLEDADEIGRVLHGYMEHVSGR